MILTLQCPVEGEPDPAIAKALRDKITPLRRRALERNISASLKAVAFKAMGVDPELRYSTVEALGWEVDRYLTGFATKAEQAGVFT